MPDRAADRPQDRGGPGPPARFLRRPASLLSATAAFIVAAIVSPLLWAQDGGDVISEAITLAIFDASESLATVGWALAIPLAILELAGAGINKLRGKDVGTIPPFFFATRGMWFILIFILLIGGPYNSVANGILSGAQSLVTATTGLAGFNPLQILQNGFVLYLDYSQITFLHGLIAAFSGNTHALLFHQLTGLLVLLAYGLVALAAYFLLVQSALTIAVAPIFSALGASRWTAPYFDLYYSYLIFLTVKCVLFGLVLAVGERITAWFGEIFSALGSVADIGVFLSSDLPIVAALVAAAYALAALTPGPLAQKLTSNGFRLAEHFLRNDK